MSGRLWLPSALAREMLRHARADAPREACGILAGRGEKVERVIPAVNRATDPEHYYRIDERQLTEVLFTLETEKLELLGFYHSHPAGDPIPSPTDIREAHYPHIPYVIVGLRGAEPLIAAWEITYGDVLPVAVIVGDTPPPAERQSFSPAQRMAIIVSMILAFLVVIMISLSLLPPAPPIP